ncbi:MAG: AAA family ATPase [Candidatus Hodarchaeales archaeon]|jgi:DNA repair exonuclease SbcCD ATPase subunit
MIPIINSLEITNVAPFETKNVIKFSKNVNKLLRQNGHGKTTLVESIEYSLFEEIYRKQKRIFLQKILEEGILKSIWTFKNNKESFGSKLFPTKTVSITSSEKIESRNIYEKIHGLIGHDAQLAQEVFHYLVVKRESEATLIGESRFIKLLQMLNEKNMEASGLSDLVRRRKQVLERERKILGNIKKINKKKNKFKEFSELFLTEVSVDDLNDEIEAIEKDIIKLENEISRLQGLDKDFSGGVDSYYQKKFATREEKNSFQKEIKERQALIKRLENEIIELESLKQPESRKINRKIQEIPLTFVTCKYCTRSLKETWQDFLDNRKCPACGRLMGSEIVPEESHQETIGINDFNLEDIVLEKRSQIDKEKAILSNFTSPSRVKKGNRGSHEGITIEKGTIVFIKRR